MIQDYQNGYLPLDDGKETKSRFNPKTTPFHSTISSADFKRWQVIHLDTLQKFLESKQQLVDKGGKFAKLANSTDYELIAFNLANELVEKGWFQNNPELRKKLILRGWWPLKASQYSEVGFTLGNIALTAYGAKVNDPLFWVPFILSIILGPLQLAPNWSGVNPGTGKIDPAKVDDELFGLDGDLRDLIAPNTKIKAKDLGCTNNFDAEFLLELAKYIEREPDNSIKILSSLYKYINYIAFFTNNIIGPPGNWMLFGYFITKISSIVTKFILGVTSFIPVLITGFMYYTAFTLKKNQIANEQMFSSRNRVWQTAKLSFPLAFQAFYDYATNDLLRALAIVATFLIALEEMGVKAMMPEDQWNAMCSFLEYKLVSLIFINTASSRLEVYGRFTKPFQFATHTGQTQTITQKDILNWKYIRPYVKSQLTIADYTRNFASSLGAGICYTLPVSILVWHLSNPEFIVSGSAGLFVLTVAIDFFNQMTHLINTRSGEVIKHCRGRAEEIKVTRQVLNFVYASLGADAIMRIFARSAVIGALGFIQQLSLPRLLLWLASAVGAVPSAFNEFWFYFLSSIENSPAIIKNIQEYATKDNPPVESKAPGGPVSVPEAEVEPEAEAEPTEAKEEKPGCGERAKRFICKQLVYYFPCFFGLPPVKQPESQSAGEAKTERPAIEIPIKSKAAFIWFEGKAVKISPEIVQAEQEVINAEKQLRWW